jgi:hypothetical protein
MGREGRIMGSIAMNKAKCLRCNDIVESKHMHDHAHCSCGNVSVCGGLINPMIRATDYSAVRGVDDAEHPISSKSKDGEEYKDNKADKAITREELLERFESRLACLHRLPQIARYSNISVDELYSWLSDISTILRSF